MRMIDIDERMPLIKAIKGWARTEDERKLVQIVINTLEAAKTVDANPVKHGTWSTCTCSECGEKWGPRNQFTRRHYQYCPVCGAKMDGEDG